MGVLLLLLLRMSKPMTATTGCGMSVSRHRMGYQRGCSCILNVPTVMPMVIPEVVSEVVTEGMMVHK